MAEELRSTTEIRESNGGGNPKELESRGSFDSLVSTDSSDEVCVLPCVGGSEEALPTQETPTIIAGKVEVAVQVEAAQLRPRRPRQRKISVRSSAAGHMGSKMEVIKEGYIMQQGRTFQRWVKKYLIIRGDRLFVAKNPESKISEEIVLKDVNVAENSTKNVNHSFTLLTPFQQVMLAASSRKEMEEWMSALKVASSKTSKQSDVLEAIQHLEGYHSWFTCSHARPTYCNVCREMLHGVAWHGLSCEVCKFKSHRRCVFSVKQPCKWTTRTSLEKDGTRLGAELSIPHQWLEGNLPAGSKCVVCERACGSVRRLQDFRCMWCKWTVHTECRDRVQRTCSLGEHSLSVLPPSMLQRSDAIRKGMWEPYKVYGHSPVLALVNSKSGDNQGVKFLRRLKYWLNPVQVFDLAISGPDLGLQLFQRFEKFRILVLGGDGSVGWVLSAIDKYNLHSKCMVGVAPLGTGNDLARVLGWGAQMKDEEKLPSLLTEMEQSTFRLLDRWSLQFTREKEIDLGPLLRSPSPIKSRGSDTTSPTGSTSPVKPVSGFRQQPVAPFPGPGTTSGSAHFTLSPDPVFSPQDSGSLTSNSDEYKSAPSRTPTPEHQNSRNSNSKSEDLPDGEEKRVDVGRQHSSLSTSSEKGNRFDGCSQVPTKIEAFHGSLVAHLSTILLSDNETAVISSAQVLCEVVKDFISSVMKDREQKLPMSDFLNDPLVQRCRVLHEKLRGLLTTLREEAEAATDPEKPDRVFRPREALMGRADSLKKAVKGVIDMTEKAVDSQAQTTAEIEALTRTALEELSLGGSSQNGMRPEPRTEPEPSSKQRLESTSSIASVVEPAPLIPETKEIACMNNYFGIGLDAKIAYQFSTTRTKSRAKNRLLYGILGGKEFFLNSQRYLERRIQLECDGKLMALPQRLQGLVFLNIPSYMAGTNFWGTDREKDGFCAPSHDDKLIEVVGITGFSQLATSKVLGIQNQRIAQCRIAKLTMLGPDTLPVQVDGEAWLQEAGTIIISHKNKARMLVKDKAFRESLESWKLKHSSSSHSIPTMAITSTLPEVLSSEELERYRQIALAVRPLIACIRSEAAVSNDVTRDLLPYVATAIASLERVFPDDQVSETADIEHLQDFEMAVKAMLQETLWFLNMHKISSEREPRMREHVQQVEGKIRRVLSSQLSTASLAQHGFRRASDTLLTYHPPSHFAKYSPVLPSHRERAGLMVPDATISGVSIAKRIGKEVEEWDVADVCQWFVELGLGAYEEGIHSRGITGRELLNLQRSDFVALGIRKVGHMALLRQALQALHSLVAPTFPTVSHRLKDRTRDTR